MELQEQIEIVKELLEATEELNGGYQEGWEENIEDGERLLVYLKSKLKNCSTPDVVHQREQFKSILFDMANDLSITGNGDEAVMMHKIHNRL